jgi:ADP-heptose:LPS heptosyltransferase
LLLLQGALGIAAPPTISFPIGVSREAEAEAERAAESTAGNYAILNPGGGWPTKLWSVEKFGGLSDLLWSNYGMRSLVTYGPGEEHLAEAVRRSAKTGSALPVNLSLKGFYSLAKTARVYDGGDTGPTHIAVAAGAPIVGLFGPTEWWRNGSPYAADICVERTDIDCRVDCHRRACSKWICMDIDVGRVFEAVERRLQIGESSLPVAQITSSRSMTTSDSAS